MFRLGCGWDVSFKLSEDINGGIGSHWMLFCIIFSEFFSNNCRISIWAMVLVVSISKDLASQLFYFFRSASRYSANVMVQFALSCRRPLQFVIYQLFYQGVMCCIHSFILLSICSPTPPPPDKCWWSNYIEFYWMYLPWMYGITS